MHSEYNPYKAPRRQGACLTGPRKTIALGRIDLPGSGSVELTCVQSSWVQHRRLHQTHIVGRARAPENTFSTRDRATQRRRSGLWVQPQLGPACDAGQTTERLSDRARCTKGTGRHRNHGEGIARRDSRCR